MDFTTIMVLLASVSISISTIVVYRIIKKRYFKGVHWIFPISPIVGFFMMYFTSDGDTFLLMLKDVLIWAFILSMIYVNIKCLIFGSKRTFNNGKDFVSEVKKEWGSIKPSFKTKKEEKDDKKDE